MTGKWWPETLLARWLKLAGRGEEYLGLLVTPDADAEVRLYTYSPDAIRAGLGRLTVYHSFGARECVAIVAEEGVARDGSLWLGLLLPLLGLDRCAAWLEVPGLLGWEPRLPLGILEGLGDLVVVAEPGDRDAARYSLGAGRVVDTGTLYSYAARALREGFEKLGLQEPDRVAVYGPGDEDTLRLLGLLGEAFGGLEVELIVEDGRAYRPSRLLGLEELIAAYREGYRAIDLDVEKVEKPGKTSGMVAGGWDTVPAGAGELVVTPPWQPPPPRGAGKTVSWILYGIGWAYGIAEAIASTRWSTVEEALEGIADLWAYQVGEKGGSPSDASGVLSVSRLLGILGAVFRARTGSRTGVGGAR